MIELPKIVFQYELERVYMYFIANSEAASKPLRRDRVKINNASNSLGFFLHNAYKKLYLLLSTI